MANKLLQSCGNPALLNQDEAQELRRGGGHLGGHAQRSASVGGGAAEVGELQVELALATRKLDTGREHLGVGLWSSCSSNRSIIVAAKTVETIQAPVELVRHLYISATAHVKRTPQTTYLGTATPVALAAVLAATMLRLVASLLLVRNGLRAAHTGRMRSGFIRTLLFGAERERPGAPKMGPLDVLGIRIMDHREGADLALKLRYTCVDGMERRRKEVTTNA